MNGGINLGGGYGLKECRGTGRSLDDGGDVDYCGNVKLTGWPWETIGGMVIDMTETPESLLIYRAMGHEFCIGGGSFIVSPEKERCQGCGFNGLVEGGYICDIMACKKFEREDRHNVIFEMTKWGGTGP